MFDIGFTELTLAAVVALVVIGPERLPGVARTLGHLFGRLQRYVNDVKSDISREIELDELKNFKNQFEDAAQSVQSSVQSEIDGAEATFSSIADDAKIEDPVTADAPEASSLSTGEAATADGESAATGSAAPEPVGEPAALPAGVEQKTAV